MRNIESISFVLKEYFSGFDFINFALVFGSFANGKENTLSDIDIGIHTTRDLELLELGKLVVDIENQTGIRADLSILNNSYKNNPSFAYQVVTNCKLIYEKEKNNFSDFKTSCFINYFDHANLRKMVEKSFDLRISNKKIGERNFVG
ncbi:MAG: nucleotidyltransferase domain-containing protein [Leptospiraceae bacterium]|nr:nucleotidyltransferase domain-containing protein [Leptospiraceae bacterium]